MNLSGGCSSGQAVAYTRSLVLLRHRVRPGTPAQGVRNVLPPAGIKTYEGGWHKKEAAHGKYLYIKKKERERSYLGNY